MPEPNKEYQQITDILRKALLKKLKEHKKGKYDDMDVNLLQKLSQIHKTLIDTDPKMRALLPGDKEGAQGKDQVDEAVSRIADRLMKISGTDHELAKKLDQFKKSRDDKEDEKETNHTETETAGERTSGTRASAEPDRRDLEGNQIY